MIQKGPFIYYVSTFLWFFDPPPSLRKHVFINENKHKLAFWVKDCQRSPKGKLWQFEENAMFGFKIHSFLKQCFFRCDENKVLQLMSAPLAWKGLVKTEKDLVFINWRPYTLCFKNEWTLATFFISIEKFYIVLKENKKKFVKKIVDS